MPKNKIVFMDETPHTEALSDRTNRPIGAALYYKADGIFNTQEELDNYPHASEHRWVILKSSI